jgi:uncharacterized protein (TIGR02569 family)
MMGTVPSGRAAPPPPTVRRAFGLAGNPTPLPGGQQVTWRVGSVVLKPLDADAETLVWQEELLTQLDGRSDFRVAPPLRSPDGSLAVDGWTAWRHEPGEHVARRWTDIIAVSGDFHRAAAAVPRPAFLDRRADRWAVADRIAWGEMAAPDLVDVPWAADVAALIAASRPVRAASQLVHGDLAKNVLFSDGLAPLVLDLSPYWRPPTTAAAIVVADALIYEGAGSEVLDAVDDLPDFAQCLLRALTFRALADLELPAPGFARAVEIALDLARDR